MDERLEAPADSADGQAERPRPGPRVKKAVSLECFVFLLCFALFFGLIGSRMGAVNLINTLMNTAYDLLVSTVFYIMAISVVAGAVSELLAEFGVIALLNKLLSPLIRPVFGLPGASIVGIFACYFSDNPAILTLAGNQSFRRYFKKYQIPALTNIGTSFGMGLIVAAFMMGLSSPAGERFFLAVVVGNIGACVGAVVSTRLMLRRTKALYGDEDCEPRPAGGADLISLRAVRSGNPASRVIEALLDGGKSGVSLGMGIIPGVLIICSIVMLLSNSMPAGGFTGGAYEGIALLPWLGEKLGFLLRPLFGFTSAQAISVPITALGSAGAAIALVPQLVSQGLANANDVAVFTALCMCWSGYLSTHIAMMEHLGFRALSGKSILCHTAGGLAAGISANWMFKLAALLLR